MAQEHQSSASYQYFTVSHGRRWRAWLRTGGRSSTARCRRPSAIRSARSHIYLWKLESVTVIALQLCAISAALQCLLWLCISNGPSSGAAGLPAQHLQHRHALQRLQAPRASTALQCSIQKGVPGHIASKQTTNPICRRSVQPVRRRHPWARAGGPPGELRAPIQPVLVHAVRALQGADCYTQNSMEKCVPGGGAAPCSLVMRSMHIAWSRMHSFYS